MMEFNLDLKEFNQAMNEKLKKVSSESISRTLKICCEKMRGEILQGMADTPRNNDITYYSGKNGTIEHHPSLPGNPPAPDTGNLRASIHYTLGETENGCIARIGTDVEYGKHLEFGTSRMAPRPWLKPALDANEDFIKESLLRLVK